MQLVNAATIVEATLSTAGVSQAAAKAAVTAGDPTSPACSIAQDHYRREWVWLNIFNLLWVTLTAATVLLLLVALYLIGTAAFGPGDALTKATKAGIAIAAAVGTIITGKASGWVVTQRATQATAVDDAVTTVGTACGQATRTAIQTQAAKERFKVIR